MGALSPLIVLLAVLVFVALVVAIAVVVVVGGRRGRRDPAVGVPPVGGGSVHPVPGAFRAFEVDVAGVPATVSIGHWTPALLRLWSLPELSANPPGTVHLEADLGTAWPPLTVLWRPLRQDLGTLSAKLAGTDAPVVPTGDPAFDAEYVVLGQTPDPRPVQAVLNPAVRAMMLTGRVLRWQMAPDGIWLVVGYFDEQQQAGCVEWTVRLATTTVLTSGVPVPRPGPPPPPPGGQVPGSAV